MEDLVQFLRDRLDEDERVARKASSSRKSGGEWQFVDMQVRAGDGAPVTAHTWVGEGTHIARHDPARVLAEVEAKRVLLDDYERFVAERRRMMGGWDSYPEPSPVLMAFAAVYADHSDYRDEWRP